MLNKISRRGAVSAALISIPLVVANAQTKPPLKKTPSPVMPLAESTYRAKIASTLLEIGSDFEKAHSKMLEVIRDSEVAKKADWVKEYVDSAIAVTSSAAAMFTYDPPRAYALSHVYLLRYCNTVREYIEALTRSIDNNDSDGFLKVLDLYKSANAELQKASTLSPK